MLESGEYQRRVEECVVYLEQVLPFSPDLVIQLGTGLGHFGDTIRSELTLPYSEIPHFPQSTVASHDGNLILGYIGKKKLPYSRDGFISTRATPQKKWLFPSEYCPYSEQKHLL